MRDENLIHVKLEYEEAVMAKKDILSFQRDLLRVLKRIKNYHKYRSEEMKVKLKVYRKIKELKIEVGKLQQTLPKIKIPEILSKGREEIIEHNKPHVIESNPSDDLDKQLEDIQERLRKLE